MYIISADTTAKTASVCIAEITDDGNVKPCVRSTVNGTLTHSESLLPMIDFCLKNANLKFSDMSAFAISAGPGSFTGVRIGVATVKGLCFGKPECKCLAVSSLEALAYNLSGYTPGSVILPVMDARRNQFYNALFTFTQSGKIKRLTDDSLTTFDEIMAVLKKAVPNRKIVLTGDGAESFYSLYKKSTDNELKISLCGYSDMYEDAFSVARCAYHKYGKKLDKPDKKGEFSANNLNPVYLRASQAERERNEKLADKSSGGN